VSPELIFIMLSGFFNGIFNCGFWMIQRLLFLETVTLENSGRKFGNFQIFVMVLLKAGIFAGGALLEKSGFKAVFLFCFLFAAGAGFYFLLKDSHAAFDQSFMSAKPLCLKSIFQYKDRYLSRRVFAMDGVFLYLESYFWVISLFVIVRQSFMKLGLLVIFLALVFSILFIAIKNTIDRLPKNKLYTLAVFLYALSWAMRGFLSDKLSSVSLLLLLTIITFCTSFFRLAFNKRFFDIAKSTTRHEYIFIKSYYSQAFLALSALIGFWFIGQGSGGADTSSLLSFVYFFAAVFSFGFLGYGKVDIHNSISTKELTENDNAGFRQAQPNR